jgi:hypothetical protein
MSYYKCEECGEEKHEDLLAYVADLGDQCTICDDCDELEDELYESGLND